MNSITLSDIRRVVREELANINGNTNPPQAEETGLLSNAEAARYIGMSTTTLNRFRKEGRGPNYVRYGRPYLYRPEDLDAWLAEQEHNVA